MDADTRFEIGSITKVFTSLLLADMVLAGEVSLDDPVTRHLPEGALANAPNITLRMLAAHRSGIASVPAPLIDATGLQVRDPLDPYANFTEEAFSAWLNEVEPVAEPDAEFAYSNAGFALLGQALAHAAGTDFESLLMERIVRPMGLEHTDFDKQGLADAYANGEKTPPWHLAMIAPAGGLVSTLGDVTAFARLLADPGERWRRHVDMLVADTSPALGSATVGLGLFQVDVGNQQFWLHNGGTGGFNTALWIEPAADRGAVVLLNSSDEPAEPLALYMLRRTAP